MKSEELRMESGDFRVVFELREGLKNTFPPHIFAFLDPYEHIGSVLKIAVFFFKFHKLISSLKKTQFGISNF